MARCYGFVYASCVMASSIVYALSYRKPPPPKETLASADSITDSFTSNPLLVAVTASKSFIVLAPAIVVSALVASGRTPSAFCPRPANVSPVFLTFNPTTVAVLISTFCGGLLRYTAMAQLGRSFTWELARPVDGFKRDGLYRYMQHPSYTGAFFANVAFISFFWRVDGPLACWLSAPWTARLWWMNGGVLFTWTVLSMLWTLWKRIPEEEAMMKKEFGKKWMEYHRHTKRFIPGVL